MGVAGSWSIVCQQPTAPGQREAQLEPRRKGQTLRFPPNVPLHPNHGRTRSSQRVLPERRELTGSRNEQPPGLQTTGRGFGTFPPALGLPAPAAPTPATHKDDTEAEGDEHRHDSNAPKQIIWAKKRDELLVAEVCAVALLTEPQRGVTLRSLW